MALPNKYQRSDDLILWLSLFHDEVSTAQANITSLQTETAQIQDSLAGYLTGCIPSNNGSDATNDLDFSAGFYFDGSRGYTVGAKTKRADAAWAAGTNAGGMANGVSFGAGDLHSFLLANPTDGTTDFGFDTDVTGAGLLGTSAVSSAGFTVAKRAASARLAGAAWQLLSAREIAKGQVKYLIKTPVLDLTKNWAGADDTAQTGTLAFVPGGIQVDAILGVVFFDSSASASSGLLITSLDQSDTAADATPGSYVGTLSLSGNGGGNFRASGIVLVTTSTSRTFRYRGIGTTADHEAGFTTHGWIDSR